MRSGLVLAGLALFGVAAWAALDRGNAGLCLLLVAVALILVGVAWHEAGPDSAKEIALVATVGGTAALVSNFFLGQGVWTPWQMLAWGACGAVGAATSTFVRNRYALAAV